MFFVATLLLIILALSSLQVWIWAWQRWRAGLPWVSWEARSPVPWRFADLLLSVFLFLLAQVMAAGALQAAGVDLRTPFEELPASQRLLSMGAFSLTSLATALAVLVWLRAARRVTREDLGLSRQRLLADLRLGFGTFLFVMPVVYTIQFLLTLWFPSKHPLTELLRENPDPAFFVVSGLVAVVVAPVTEEFFFRLLVQGWLEKFLAVRTPPESPLEPVAQADSGDDGNHGIERSPPEEGQEAAVALVDPVRPLRRQVLPLVGSSLLFAVAHYQHGPDPIPLFVLALALGYLYQRTHRIVPCLVVHAALNSMSLVALLIHVYSTDKPSP